MTTCRTADWARSRHALVSAASAARLSGESGGRCSSAGGWAALGSVIPSCAARAFRRSALRRASHVSLDAQRGQ
jgi:hypothetical protein